MLHKSFTMKVTFDKVYLRELYTNGRATDKKYRFQPGIIKKYIRVIDMMIDQPDIASLAKFNSLRYKKLKGDKIGLSSVRVNDQYRIEFEEKEVDNQNYATICNIIDLSNHYK